MSKVHSKEIKDFNLKPKMLRLLMKMGDTLQDSGLTELLNRPAVGQRLALSVSSNYLGLREMKSLKQNKGKPSAEQTDNLQSEKICTS